MTVKYIACAYEEVPFYQPHVPRFSRLRYLEMSQLYEVSCYLGVSAVKNELSILQMQPVPSS